MSFNRPANDRSLSFKEIASEAKIPLHEVCYIKRSIFAFDSLLFAKYFLLNCFLNDFPTG